MIFGIRLSALIEMLVFFAVVIGLSYPFDGGMRFIDTSPHPFWIILLLITVQYGTKEGLVCAFLACAALYAGNLPDNRFVNMYEYLVEVLATPFLWVGTALILGGLRTRQLTEHDELETGLKAAEEEKETLAHAYNRLKSVKENLETRIASEMKSAISIYKAAKSLEKIDHKNLLAAIEDVVINILGPGKFSIFLLERDSFEINSCYGWGEEEPYRTSFPASSPLYRGIMSGRDILCAVKESDERLLDRQGVMAGALVDNNSGEIFGMLKIEHLDFRQLSLNNIEIFRVLCEWIGTAYGNNRRYKEACDNTIFDLSLHPNFRSHFREGGAADDNAPLHDYRKRPEGRIYSRTFFLHQVEFLTALAERVGFNLSMIAVRIQHDSGSERYRICAAALADSVGSALRRTDNIFMENRDNYFFVLLLPGTSDKEAKLVLDRIRNEIDGWQGEDEKLGVELSDFDFSIEILHKIPDKPHRVVENQISQPRSGKRRGRKNAGK